MNTEHTKRTTDPNEDTEIDGEDQDYDQRRFIDIACDETIQENLLTLLEIRAAISGKDAGLPRHALDDAYLHAQDALWGSLRAYAGALRTHTLMNRP